MNRMLSAGLMTAALLLFIATPFSLLHAQAVANAQMCGVITDPSGAPIPTAKDNLGGSAWDLDAECLRHSTLLQSVPIHLAFVGFGENGHIAFNDRGVDDFHDPKAVKTVTLNEACRKQQLGEGYFPDFASVPTQALTITPCLLRAGRWVCYVPDSRKANAVQNAFEGALSTACPASLVRTHPAASVFLDRDSAVLLNDFALQPARS